MSFSINKKAVYIKFFLTLSFVFFWFFALNQSIPTTCMANSDIKLNMPFQEWEDTISIWEEPNSFNIVQQYVWKVYSWWASVTGLLAVLMVVVWGVQYIISGADPGQKDDAKERIKQALIALTLLMLSALILYTINPNFFVL